MILSEISRRRSQVSALLGGIVVVTYFGFILLIAFDRQLMAIRVVQGLSLGMLLGVLVILIAWITTWVYVRWANRHYDVRVQRIRSADNQSGKDLQ